jgi:hypothetical protein
MVIRGGDLTAIVPLCLEEAIADDFGEREDRSPVHQDETRR